MKTKRIRGSPSLKPQGLGKSDWYYEARGSLTLIHEVRDKLSDAYIRTDSIIIPWSKLIKSAKRCRPEEVK